MQTQTSSPDHSFRHLQLEMMRIDLLIHRELQRWQQASAHNHSALSGHYVSDAEANALLKQPFGTHWRFTVAPETATKATAYEKAIEQIRGQAAAVAETAAHQSHILRLEYLRYAFGLSQFEQDVLLICLAPALDLRYERIYGYLLDDATRKQPTINLILDLLCQPGPERLQWLTCFDAESPLFKYNLLEKQIPADSSLLNTTLTVDPAVTAWMLGQQQLHRDLTPHARFTWPAFNDFDLMLVGDILQPLADTTATQPLFVFHGPDGERQKAAVRLMTAQLQRPLLTIDLQSTKKAQMPATHILRLALRDATLTGAVPCFTNWDAWLTEDAPPANLLGQICAYPDFVFITGKARWRARELERARRFLWLDFPLPLYTQRKTLWQQCLADVDQSDLDIDKLAGQFVLSSGQIRDVVATTRDTADQYGRAIQNDDLFAAAREHSNSRLAALARKIKTRYEWEDLILPDDQLMILRELVATVLGRPFVLEEWEVGKKLAASAGITVLFAGPPGTGKTMAAEVVAKELGLDLYKIDLSSVVSKYIGETEKNLEKIFNEAESSNAVLFFDEADSIFGKRSEVRDAHDRYANIEVSYLLQRMETYDGVTILATNLRANLDEAFMRRIQFAVDFPFPDAQDRLRIWRTLMPDAVPAAPDLDLERMARQFKIAGGNIRNIIVNATYLAATNGRQITMEHLMHGTRRELQKMGRLVNEEDLEV